MLGIASTAWIPILLGIMCLASIILAIIFRSIIFRSTDTVKKDDEEKVKDKGKNRDDTKTVDVSKEDKKKPIEEKAEVSKPNVPKPEAENIEDIEKQRQKEVAKYFIEPWKSKDGWRFRLRHKNGRIIASSEAYSNKRNMSISVNALVKATSFSVIEKTDK